MTYEECAEVGMTVRETAEARGVTQQNVHQYAKRHGLQFASGLKNCGGLRISLRKTTPDQVAELAAEGYSQATAALMVGVSRERIRQIANKHGIAFLPGEIDYDTREKVAELHAKGMTASEISEAAGCQQYNVWNHLKALGLKPHKPPKHSKYEAAIRDMAAQGMTVGEVAQRLGIPQTNVSKIKRKFGIEFTVDGRGWRKPC